MGALKEFAVEYVIDSFLGPRELDTPEKAIGHVKRVCNTYRAMPHIGDYPILQEQVMLALMATDAVLQPVYNTLSKEDKESIDFLLAEVSPRTA